MNALEFNEEKHEYKYDGVPVPSVTTALGFLADLYGIPADILENARQRGTAVHRAIELHLADDLDKSSMHPEVACRFNQFLRFCQETGFKPERSELRVYSDRYKYAGTLDLIGTIGRKRVVIDTKATAALPRYVGPQTAGYESALREMGGSRKELKRYALQLKPETYILHALEDPRDFRVFLACLTVHNWRNEK